MTTALTRYRRRPFQEPTLRLIAFQLRHHWFCLPLVMARRVLPTAADDAARGLGLTLLHQESVPILDLADRVYQPLPLLPGSSPRLHDSTPEAPNPQSLQSIVVVDSPRFGALGLLVDGIPALKRVKQSAFSPVPASYLVINRLQGINTLVSVTDAEPPLFLLEVDALVF
jgi:chemotaxis signal transduction protein